MIKYILILLLVAASGCTLKHGTDKFSECGGEINDTAGCYYRIFSGNDASVCSGQNETMASGCYYTMALKFNDTSLCGHATDANWRDLCYYTLATVQKNSGLCESIRNATMLVQCKHL